MVYTIGENSSGQNVSSSSNLQTTLHLPEEIAEMIADLTLKERALLNYQKFLAILLRNHGLAIQNLKIHPDYPFLNLFHVHDLFRLPKEALCFFWYLFESHTIGISFNLAKLQSYILQCQFDSAPPHSRNLFSLLQWFLPAHQWTKLLTPNKPYVVLLFRRPAMFFPPPTLGIEIDQGIVYHSPTSMLHGFFDVNPSSTTAKIFFPACVLKIRTDLAEANMVDPKTIPKEIMLDVCAWSDDHPVSTKWIAALDEYWKKHLKARVDTSDEFEVADDDEEDTQQSDYNEDYDPYEDDPSHPDSRWK